MSSGQESTIGPKTRNGQKGPLNAVELVGTPKASPSGKGKEALDFTQQMNEDRSKEVISLGSGHAVGRENQAMDIEHFEDESNDSLMETFSHAGHDFRDSDEKKPPDPNGRISAMDAEDVERGLWGWSHPMCPLVPRRNREKAATMAPPCPSESPGVLFFLIIVFNDNNLEC